jgi:hypothetical protein
MLQRDLPRRRDTEWREAEKRRIEMELQQAKRDMESEDLLDEIADNPSGMIWWAWVSSFIKDFVFFQVSTVLLSVSVFAKLEQPFRSDH